MGPPCDISLQRKPYRHTVQRYRHTGILQHRHIGICVYRHTTLLTYYAIGICVKAHITLSAYAHITISFYSYIGI